MRMRDMLGNATGDRGAMGRFVWAPVLLAGLIVTGCGLFESEPNVRIERAHKLYAQGSHISAYRQYKQLADRGNADAQFAIGYMYEKGQVRGMLGMFGSAPDYDEAQKWYRMAAERGLANAQSNLGRMYAGGVGVARETMARRRGGVPQGSGSGAPRGSVQPRDQVLRGLRSPSG